MWVGDATNLLAGIHPVGKDSFRCPHTTISTVGESDKIADIPAGTYKLNCWNARLGTQSQSITVSDGNTEVDISLSEKRNHKAESGPNQLRAVCGPALTR